MAGIPDQLQAFKTAIEDAGFPTTIDEPSDPFGQWWIDIFDPGSPEEASSIEEINYAVGYGFGFYSQPMACGFGERPTDIVGHSSQAIEIALERLRQVKR